MHPIEYVLPTTFTRTVMLLSIFSCCKRIWYNICTANFMSLEFLVTVDWQTVSFVGLCVKSLHSEKCTSENYSMSIYRNVCLCVLCWCTHWFSRVGITEFEHIHMHINLDVLLLLILFSHFNYTKLSIVNGKQMHMCVAYATWEPFSR